MVDRVPARFELVVLWVPWQAKAAEPGSGYHPLLVTEQRGSLRAVGFILPWNEVMPQLETEMASVIPLSIIWVTRVSVLKAGTSPPQPGGATGPGD
jgi:hypothetical protein